MLDVSHRQLVDSFRFSFASDDLLRGLRRWFQRVATVAGHDDTTCTNREVGHMHVLLGIIGWAGGALFIAALVYLTGCLLRGGK